MRTGGPAIAVAAVLAVAGCGGDTTSASQAPPAGAGAGQQGGGQNQNQAGSGHSADALATLAPAARRFVDAVGAKDSDKFVSAFAPDGVVVDTGREIRGHDAIRRWVDNEVMGHELTLLGNTPTANGTSMLVRFGGSSGFQAYYDLDIANDLITRAVLRYA